MIIGGQIYYSYPSENIPEYVINILSKHPINLIENLIFLLKNDPTMQISYKKRKNHRSCSWAARQHFWSQCGNNCSCMHSIRCPYGTNHSELMMHINLYGLLDKDDATIRKIFSVPIIIIVFRYGLARPCTICDYMLWLTEQYLQTYLYTYYQIIMPPFEIRYSDWSDTRRDTIKWHRHIRDDDMNGLFMYFKNVFYK